MKLKILEIGKMVPEFEPENLFVLFGQSAPPELREISVIIDFKKNDNGIYFREGSKLVISGREYTITEVGAGTATEANADGYTTTSTGTTGEIVDATQGAVFTNTKGGTVDTGVYLDNLPYIIVFAGVLAAVAVLVIRRRRVDD